MDRRLTPFSGRIAAESLRGSVKADTYVAPEPRQIAGNPFLLAEPGGARDRQCLAGDSFGLIETRGDWAFGQAAKDGYCGWLPAGALTDPVTATHRVAARTTWLYPSHGVRPPALADLHCNARVRHLGAEGRWARVACGGLEGFVPEAHLRPLDTPETDPVAVLKRFIGTPYVWAGNTGFGIDCSGLVQAALLACGQPCPGDSDLQEQALGRSLGPGEALKARDLIFWKGHVAMLADDTTLLHANGHAMCVAWEPVAEAIARIEAAGHPMLSARRL
jgi:hypothetical protein